LIVFADKSTGFVNCWCYPCIQCSKHDGPSIHYWGRRIVFDLSFFHWKTMSCLCAQLA